MLKQRAVTGVLYTAFMLGAILLLPPLGFTLFAGLLCVGCFIEWMPLAHVEKRLHQLLWTIPFLVGLGLIYVFPLVKWVFLAIACFIWAGLTAWLVACQAFGKITPLSSKTIMLSAFLTLLPMFAGLTALRAMTEGELWVLLVFVVVWSTDTSAYFVGKTMGRHKIAPLLSPGKSVEGLLGAMIFTVVAVGLYYTYVLHIHYPVDIMSMVVVWVLLSVVGDFFESALKRLRGVKDSGRLLPGHGGILDRLDSLIALTPCLAYGLLRGMA